LCYWILEIERKSKMTNRAGYYKTNLSGVAEYKSFVPRPLPPEPPVEIDSGMARLLVEANRQIALLDGFSSYIPNINLFISMYVRKEALMSAQIEGTQATLEDVLDPSMDENANRQVSDVINYIKAVNFAIDRLRDLPLCNRLIKETHEVLMMHTRGQEKSPGEFRRSQNWLGGQGSTLSSARYIPPEPFDMDYAMSALEKYMNTYDTLDVLIRAALIHYQFETIHPFLDGNGRLGRLLITLFLIQQGALTKPSLYISYYLKKNRVEYFDRLNEVRQKGNYEQWIKFFLEAVFESAGDAVKTINTLNALRNENIVKISQTGRRAKTALRLFAYLEEHPIIDIMKTAKALNITFKTISEAVNLFCEKNILVQSSGGKRNRTFSYKSYLDILRDGT